MSRRTANDRRSARAKQHAATYTAVSNPAVANGIANAITGALSAITESDVPKQDVALALAMVFAVYVRRSNLVEADAEKMIRVCLRAPLVEHPVPRGEA